MEDLKDKIPSLTDIVENGEKAAETIEKRPIGSTVYFVMIMAIGMAVYFGWQAHEAQEKLNKMAERAFSDALEKDKVIKAQAEAIDTATVYLQDSIRPVNVKNFKGNIKIKKK